MRFKGSRDKIEDGPCSGRPSTSLIEENIEQVGNVIRKDCRLTIRAVAEIVGIDKETIQQIWMTF